MVTNLKTLITLVSNTDWFSLFCLQNEYKVKYDRTSSRYGKASVVVKQMPAKDLALSTPFSTTIMQVGCRVIAKFRDDFNTEPEGNNKYYVGIVAEPPKATNKFR